MAIFSKEWSKLHPIRWKRMQAKYRLKHRAMCKYCGQSNVELSQQFCSSVCRKSQLAELRKARIDSLHFSFIKYKERIGCFSCRYKKYGGSLDYHHIDSNTKERRITAIQWWNETPSHLEEVSKCILVCKNCHYEIHANNRKEKENGTI